MSILCKVGLHKWKPVVSVDHSYLDYFSAHYFNLTGVIVGRKFCTKCKKKK